MDRIITPKNISKNNSRLICGFWTKFMVFTIIYSYDKLTGKTKMFSFIF